MTIPIFIGIAAVIFVIGVFFVVRGISAEDQQAVPISSPEEIQELKNAYTPPKSPAPEAKGKSERTIEVYSGLGVQTIEENHQLRKDLSEQQVKSEQLEKEMDSLKQKYSQMQDQQAREKELFQQERAKFEGEKTSLSSKSDILSELKVKTEMLQRQYEEAQKQHVEMSALIQQLKSEKDLLLMEARRKDDQAAVQMKEQRAEAGKIEFEAMSAKLVESITMIEGLKRENKDLQQALEDLKGSFKKTSEMNDHLLQKEKMMQYELTKNRAQALGLEKICEDFRTQIEMMAEAATRQ